MALISCLDCRRDVSDRAVSCPHCGCPTQVSVSAAARPPAGEPPSLGPLAAATSTERTPNVGTLNVKLETPIGTATVGVVQAVARSPAWGRLYSTAFALSWLWAAILVVIGLQAGGGALGGRRL